MDSGVLGFIITVLLALAIIVFIIAKIHNKIEEKKHKKSLEIQRKECEKHNQ